MESAFNPAEAFRAALSIVGTQERFAAVCGKLQPAISKRLKAGKPAEPDEVLAIEAELRKLGHVKPDRHDLRPDLYPREDQVAPVNQERAR